jgi:8-oxo-(d)GTP phosphatase
MDALNGCAERMDALNAASPVRAAGGVVWRHGPGAGQAVAPDAAGRRAGRGRASGSPLEIVLVHRPRYDDWSLPKGKLRRHEHPLVAACREVEEETGVRPRAGTRLPTVDYQVRTRNAVVDKVVDYWTMAVVEYGPPPHGLEVDEVSWLPVDAALDRLSYTHDVRVVAAFAELPALHWPVAVIRPAAARRRGWSGPDADRPLSAAGEVRSRQLARVLACYVPQELVSAPTVRCRQTLEPLSRRLGIPVRVDPGLDAVGGRLASLVRGDGPVVVCPSSPDVAAITGSAGSAGSGGAGTATRRAEATGPERATGTGWAVAFAGNRVVVVDELD